MAAKKKKAKPAGKSKKKSAAKRSRAAKLKMPRAAAPPAGLKALDSEWRSFIKKSVPDEPLTEVWKAPKGTASAKTTIRLAMKNAAKKAKKKTAVRRKAPARRKSAKKK
jgi:hypothetical protein